MGNRKTKAEEFMMKLDAVREKYDAAFPTEWEAEKDLHYQNGLNGTYFELAVNKHLCDFFEFYTGGPNQGKIRMVLRVMQNGTVNILVREDSGKEHNIREEIFRPEEVVYMGDYLQIHADEKEIWSKAVSKIDMTHEEPDQTAKWNAYIDKFNSEIF